MQTLGNKTEMRKNKGETKIEKRQENYHKTMHIDTYKKRED